MDSEIIHAIALAAPSVRTVVVSGFIAEGEFHPRVYPVLAVKAVVVNSQEVRHSLLIATDDLGITDHDLLITGNSDCRAVACPWEPYFDESRLEPEFKAVEAECRRKVEMLIRERRR